MGANDKPPEFPPIKNPGVPLTKKLTLKQDFVYVKGDCSLAFSLNIQDIQNVEDFKQLMTEALKDLELILQSRRVRN